MFQLAPSLISADFKNLQKQINILQNNGIKYLHLDVMDGVYVPNLSFGPPIIKSIRSGTQMVFDVHIMAEEPIRFIEALSDAGTNVICVHYEACKDLLGTIEEINRFKIKAGVALNPETSVEVLTDKVYSCINVVHIMSVRPGIGGQKFIPESLEKIRKVRKTIDRLGYDIDVEVDGDVNLHNIKDVLNAGANIIVAGREIFDGNLTENIRGFQKEFRNFMGDREYEVSYWN